MDRVYNTDRPHQAIGIEYLIHRFLASLINIEKYI